MAKYIAGHTGKIAYEKETTARWVAKNNKFNTPMRAYKCCEGGTEHWHCTRYTKAEYRVVSRKRRGK